MARASRFARHLYPPSCLAQLEQSIVQTSRGQFCPDRPWQRTGLPGRGPILTEANQRRLPALPISMPSPRFSTAAASSSRTRRHPRSRTGAAARPNSMAGRASRWSGGTADDLLATLLPHAAQDHRGGAGARRHMAGADRAAPSRRPSAYHHQPADGAEASASVLAINHDISSLKRAQQELETREAHLRLDPRDGARGDGDHRRDRHHLVLQRGCRAAVRPYRGRYPQPERPRADAAAGPRES